MAVKSMTPFVENATSAIDPKWIEVTVLTGVDRRPLSPPLASRSRLFPRVCGSAC